MGVKKLAIPALATAGGAGAGAGGAYATGSYLSQSSVKSDVSYISSSSTLGTDGTSDNELTTSVSVITNKDYKKTYSDYTESKDVTAGECSKDIFNISDFKTGPFEVTAKEKGCLYVDVQQFQYKAVLVTIEMTLMTGSEGLIFGTKIHNTKFNHELKDTKPHDKVMLRQTNWSLKVEKNSGNNWKIKEGWRWSSPIFALSESIDKKITFGGKAVGGNDISVDLSGLCDIENCSTDGSMASVLHKKYKWNNEDSGGEEMFQFLKVSLHGANDSILYWTGQKLIFDEQNESDFVDGKTAQQVESEDGETSTDKRSACEYKKNAEKAPSTGRIFYTHKLSEKNWQKAEITKGSEPFILTECAFGVAKQGENFQTVKFKWVG